MARRETTTLALGLAAFCAGVVVILFALLLGFHIEASPADLVDSEKGQRIAVPAVIAVITAVVALAGRRRRWALAVGWVAVAAAVLAVLVAVLLPGG
jgi:hypothetical protein